jgi:argininosuccinate lyase
MLSLQALAGMVNRPPFPHRPDARRRGSGFATATDLADWLVRAAACRSAKRTTSPAAR